MILRQKLLECKDVNAVYLCLQEKIKWRSNATHLLVYSSDANVHIAGDGRLGGVVRPNDGQCYLDNRGSYTKGNEMVSILYRFIVLSQ